MSEQQQSAVKMLLKIIPKGNNGVVITNHKLFEELMDDAMEVEEKNISEAYDSAISDVSFGVSSDGDTYYQKYFTGL
jgi:hypothetical protein